MISTLAAIQVLCDEIDREIRKPDVEVSRTAVAYLTRQLTEKARSVQNRAGSLIGKSLQQQLQGPESK